MRSLKQLTKNFKALANERRLKIIKLLLKESELSVGKISDMINLSFRSTSKHLKILENANFVEWKQIGTNMHYSISRDLPVEFIKLIKKFS